MLNERFDKVLHTWWQLQWCSVQALLLLFEKIPLQQNLFTLPCLLLHEVLNHLYSFLQSPHVHVQDSFTCLLVIFHSTDDLDVSANSFMGMIPSQFGLLTKWCESSVVWLLVIMIVLSCVFDRTLMLACHIHSTAYLDLSSNSLMSTIPSEVGLLTKLSESGVVWLLVAMIVMCFSLYFHACLSYSFRRCLRSFS